MTVNAESEISTDLWRPEVLIEKSSADRSRLIRLRAEPDVVVLDQLDRIAAEIGGDAGEPHWVYFPWRRALVRLPEPAVYRRTRSDRNRNRITNGEQERLGEATIGVIGLSVGHVIAHTLAMEGVGGTIRLADGDHIELSNLNRLPATVLDLGLNKAVCAARRLFEIDPFLDVQPWPDGVDATGLDAFVSGLDVLVEVCDSLDMKLAVRERARRHGVPVIMHTSDRGLLDVERFDLEPDRPVFHGLIGDVDASTLEGLPLADKVPFVLDLLQASEVSGRVAASFVELNHSLTSWPQLAEDVVLGAAGVTAVARRIILGEPVPSGRSRTDLDQESSALRRPEPKSSGTTGAVGLPTADQRGAGPAVPDDLSDPGQRSRYMATAAGRAPSGGNVQPWTFRSSDGDFIIDLDPKKTTGIDVAWRGSQVAVGAASFNAEVAASSLGRHAEPVASGQGPNVSVRLPAGTNRDTDLDRLHPHLNPRATNRGAGIDRALPRSFSTLAVRWAERLGAGIRIIEKRTAMDDLGRLIGAADRLRYLDARLHEEMMGELRWPGQDTRTGIEVESLNLTPSGRAVLELLNRADVVGHLSDWDGGTALAEPTIEAVGSASALAVVVARSADTPALIDAGRCVQAVWLEADRLGLALHPISPLFLYLHDEAEAAALVDVDRAAELWELGRRFRLLAGIVGDEHPALVLRVIHPSTPATFTERLDPVELLESSPMAGDRPRH